MDEFTDDAPVVNRGFRQLADGPLKWKKSFIEQKHFIPLLPYFIEYSAHFFYIENDAEIFPALYTWKVAEKGFKMAFMMNKPAMINSCEIILEI